MDERELRALVAETIREVMARTSITRKALVLWSGALLGFEEAADALERLHHAGWVLNQVQTDSARHVLDPARIQRLGFPELTGDIVRDHQMLLVPTLTCNLAAKAASGIADCLASNLFHQFLLQGRPVVAVRVGACPDSTEKRTWYPNIPPAMAARLRRNLDDLEDFGVALCAADQLDTAAEHTWAQRLGTTTRPPETNHPSTTPTPSGAVTLRDDTTLVSHATIAQLPPGATLHVSQRTLVTALAQDLARSRQVTIERNERER